MMSRSLTEAVAELAATGLDQKQLTLLLEIVTLSTGNSTGQKADTAAERRRAYDRERKAAKRISTGNSTGIPPDHENALSLSSSPIQIQGREEKKERKRGEKIPPDWKPNIGHVAAGKQLGFTEDQIHEQAQDMRLWAQSNEHRAVARKSDWDMTFLSWLRRNKPQRGKGNGKINGHGNSVMDAFDDLIARAGGETVDNDPPMRDITPGRA